MTERSWKSIFKQMAETGHAPNAGCSLFGVGYEEAFEALRRTYLVESFAEGDSSEKFVVGPFGSGKTHFVRQLMELARGLGCATIEVSLNKDVDFTKTLEIYKLIAAAVWPPNSATRGFRALLESCTASLRSQAPDGDARELIVRNWIDGVGARQFAQPQFGRIARLALEAIEERNEGRLESPLRWLQGEVSDRDVAKQVRTGAIPLASQGNFGRQATMSLFQLIKEAGFTGTVLCFDEAEQGLDVDRRRRGVILSMLQSDINELIDLRDGSALVVFAITQDLRDRMMEFPALQQRIKDPIGGMGFFDGNPLAPTIDLTQRRLPVTEELTQITENLMRLFEERVPGATDLDWLNIRAEVAHLAVEVAVNEASAGNRRTVVKGTCALLLKRLSATNTS